MQLALLDDETPDWKIDPETCEIGRRGIAEARATLRRSQGTPGPRHAAVAA